MLKQRTLALLLAGSITLALGTTIVAADPGAADTPSPAPTQTETAAPVESAAPTETPEVLPDAEGTLSFANMEQRIREKNLNMLVLQESIKALEVLDYEKMEDDLRDALNGIADAQWGMIQMYPSMVPGLPGVGSALSASMQSSYDAVKKQFDAIRDGELQADNAALIRQLKNGQDQVVIMGETLYAGLISLDYSKGALERQLAALDRQIQVAELSYTQGNVSALALQEAKAGRTALVSGIETLKMSEATLKMQLESLIGEKLDGAVLLQSVPQVTAEEIAAMDMAADYEAAKAVSYELFAAQRALEDAKEAFEDNTEDYSSTSTAYQYLSAKHQWQSAQYTYAAAVESYELKFKTLYLQTKDYYQAWEAAKVALAAEEAGFAADEMKFNQGRISQNALLDARDALTSAREKVATTGLDLFTSYNNYRWAVEHGILN